MSRLAHFLLWGHERGTLAYDLLGLLMLLFLFLVPAAWLGDPMSVRP